MSEPKTTTLNEIRQFNPCKEGWTKLLKFLDKTEADDEPILMSTILKSNGLLDAIWCLRVFYKNYKQSVIDFACDCAESVLPIWEEWAKLHTLKHLEAPRQAITIARKSGHAAADAAAAAAAAADADAAVAAAGRAAADAAARAGRADAAFAAAARAGRAARAAVYAAFAAVAAAGRAAADATDAAVAAADAAVAAAVDAEKVMQAKFLIKHFG